MSHLSMSLLTSFTKDQTCFLSYLSWCTREMFHLLVHMVGSKYSRCIISMTKDSASIMYQPISGLNKLKIWSFSSFFVCLECFKMALRWSARMICECIHIQRNHIHERIHSCFDLHKLDIHFDKSLVGVI